MPGVEADFAGLSPDADEPLEPELIDWADVVFVMERRQAKRLKALFGPRLRGRRVVVLDVPDRYEAFAPALEARLLPRLRAALQG